jgi:hypothetical protein
MSLDMIQQERDRGMPIIFEETRRYNLWVRQLYEPGLLAYLRNWDGNDKGTNVQTATGSIRWRSFPMLSFFD